MVLRKSPKFNKRSHKLTLVALSADMCQTYHKIILKKVLNNNISIYSSQIEINRQLVNHLQLVMFHKIPENTLYLSLRNVLYSPMLYELL